MAHAPVLPPRHPLATPDHDESSTAVVPPPSQSSPAQPSRGASFSPGMPVGPFQLIEKIGEGGMGQVWSAHDARLKRRVALKLVRTGEGGGQAGSQARLLREAQAIAQLTHPNVVAVYDTGLW